MSRTRSDGGLDIRWAIDATPGGSLSLDTATAEARDILRSVKASPLRYRRVTLKGTFALPGPGGVAESMVVRAVYFRPTVRAIAFDEFDPAERRTILDLADELRLAVVLGGYGIPPEPPTEPQQPGAG